MFLFCSKTKAVLMSTHYILGKISTFHLKIINCHFFHRKNHSTLHKVKACLTFYNVKFVPNVDSIFNHCLLDIDS